VWLSAAGIAAGVSSLDDARSGAHAGRRSVQTPRVSAVCVGYVLWSCCVNRLDPIGFVISSVAY